jgi:hypothetical protein
MKQATLHVLRVYILDSTEVSGSRIERYCLNLFEMSSLDETLKDNAAFSIQKLRYCTSMNYLPFHRPLLILDIYRPI